MSDQQEREAPWGRLTVLLENDAISDDLAHEHGLSLWIETPGGNILFDTGQSDAFRDNARKLGVDLGTADAVVLSHGHYDHAGGLGAALDATKAPVYMGPRASAPKRARGARGMRDVGMDASLIQGLGERLRVVESRREILESVEVLPAATLATPVPSDNERLLRETSEGIEQDPFEDEISLLLHTPSGPVLVTGCSHRGIVNIYRDAGSVRVVVGGLHLTHETPEVVRQIATLLSGVDELWVGHCTGKEAVAILEHEFAGPVVPIPAGTRLPL